MKYPGGSFSEYLPIYITYTKFGNQIKIYYLCTMIKYTPVSSFPEVSGDEYNAYKQALNWIDESRMYYPDIDYTNKDYVSDLIFTPTDIGKNPDPKITPKEELQEDSKPVSIPKKETKGDSKLEFTSEPGNDKFREYYLKAVGKEDDMYNFLSKVAHYESGYNPTAKNPNAPAYGYFQFMQDGVNYKNITDYGDVDIDTFLNTPEIQINAARSLADTFLKSLKKVDLEKMYEKGITRSGALGAMWLAGYGGFKKYLYHDKDLSDSHWYSNGEGVKISDQIKRYNGIFKRGGKIEKASLGTILSNDDQGYKTRPGVGVLMNDYFGKDKYDYSMSPEIPEDGGHWPSRDPYTGLLLKSKYHPTINKEYEESKRLGLKLYEDRNGRQYTLEEWQANMPEYIIKGLKEVDYSMLPPNPFDKSIGQHMSGHTSEEEYLKYLPYNSYFSNAAKEFDLPEDILIHLASTESHFDSSAKNNATGAEGIMQIMPKSLQNFKNSGKWNPELTDEENNIRAGAYILKYFYDVYKNWGKALMAYKGISKDKMSPSHPDYESVINDNKINYLLQYANSK